MTPSDLIPKGSTDIAPVPNAPFIDSFGDETVESGLSDILPFLRIVQPSTPEKPPGCSDGEMYNTLTGVHMEEWKLVWLDARRQNVQWPPYDPTVKAMALCKSENAITPTGGTNPQPGPCQVRHPKTGRLVSFCPKIQWIDDRKPECSMVFNFLVVDLLTMSPVVMPIQRTAIKATRRFKSSLEARKREFWDPKNPDIPANLLVPVIVRPVKVKTWFEPVFTILARPEDRIPVDIARMLMDMKARLRPNLEAMQVEDIDTRDDVASSDPGGTEVFPEEDDF